jgi:hypothetical protein
METKKHPQSKRWICLFLLAISVLNLFGQNSISLAGFDLVNGERKTIVNKAIIGTFAAHKKFGGIVFENVAIPAENFSADQISLSIGQDSSLVVTIIDSYELTSSYETNIPLWQVKPIAEFANDSLTGVVTIIDDVRYHEAFINTLLGLRFYQADLMFTGFGSYNWQLPVDTNQNVVLAPSERSVLHNLKDTATYKIFYDVLKKAGYTNIKSPWDHYTSYILTDWGTETNFNVYEDRFFLTGEPYFLFTKYKTDYADYANQVCGSYTSYKDRWSASLYKEVSRICGHTNLNSWDGENLEKLLNAKGYYSYYYFDKNEMLDIDLATTEEIQGLNNLIYAYNPVVMESVITTARYAAFFRYIKNTYPDNWDKFVEDLRQFENPNKAFNVYTPTGTKRKQ